MAMFIGLIVVAMRSVSTYYISKTFSDIPFQIIFPAVFISIVFWMLSKFTLVMFTNCPCLTNAAAACVGRFGVAAILDRLCQGALVTVLANKHSSPLLSDDINAFSCFYFELLN